MIGAMLALPMLLLSLAISVGPLWFAAKVVGAGRTEFLRVAAALVLATAIAAVALTLSVGWGIVATPLVFIVVFGKTLDTSYLGAFVLCVLWLSFQWGIFKFAGGALGA